MIELGNVPVPVPSVVLVDKATVGPVVVLQQTPRAVTAMSPWLVTLPPEVAVVVAIGATAVVVIVGSVGKARTART